MGVSFDCVISKESRGAYKQTQHTISLSLSYAQTGTQLVNLQHAHRHILHYSRTHAQNYNRAGGVKYKLSLNSMTVNTFSARIEATEFTLSLKTSLAWSEISGKGERNSDLNSATCTVSTTIALTSTATTGRVDVGFYIHTATDNQAKGRSLL